MGKKEDDFLKEIQSKINKRSGGYYYNKQIKKFKRNLIFTASVFVIVMILFLILRILSIRTAEKINFNKLNKKKTQKIEKKNNGLKFKTIKLKKESYRYIFSNIKPKDIDFLLSLSKRYTNVTKDDKVIFLVPQKEREVLLDRFSNREFNIKKELYIQEGIYEQFIFDKKLFPKDSFKKK